MLFLLDGGYRRAAIAAAWLFPVHSSSKARKRGEAGQIGPAFRKELLNRGGEAGLGPPKRLRTRAGNISLTRIA
jgi:hypothetical protein